LYGNIHSVIRGAKSPLPPFTKRGKEATSNSLLIKGGLGGIYDVGGIVIAGKDFLYPRVTEWLRTAPSRVILNFLKSDVIAEE
jgi:hypothetical protein